MKRIRNYFGRIGRFGVALVVVFGGFLLCSSCGRKQKTDDFIAPSKGIPYELLLVVDKPVWESAVGDTLQAILKGSVPGLPQHEPMFKLLRVFPENYVQMYVTMRNTLFVRLNSETPRPRMGVAYNVQARPQIYVTVEGPDLKSLGAFLWENRQKLTDLFVEEELQLEANRLRKKYHRKVDQDVRALFGYSVKVPEEIRATKKAENFLWASTNLNDKDLNFVMYAFPYDSRELLDKTYWVCKRDSVLKRNIPGSEPDQWMTTTWEENMPIVELRERNLDGQHVWELRGLWELRHGGIGGPFVSLARLDSVKGRFVVCEGFVYSPRTNKRNLMRRMEAALRTLERVER